MRCLHKATLKMVVCGLSWGSLGVSRSLLGRSRLCICWAFPFLGGDGWKGAGGLSRRADVLYSAVDIPRRSIANVDGEFGSCSFIPHIDTLSASIRRDS